MTLFFNTIDEMNLGYAAIFLCIGVGFLFIRKIDREEVGPGYWAASFFLNGAGFILWSRVIPIAQWQYFLLGEVAHVLGFFMLIWGAYRFSGYSYRTWNAVAALTWIALWALSIVLLKKHTASALLALKYLRAVLYIPFGVLMLAKKGDAVHFGQKIAGSSLIAWGLYTIVFSFLHLDRLLNLAYGFLVGFQVLAALGMVAMVIDRMRSKAQEHEKLIHRLEGLLPICSYCKKIRDKDDAWQTLELYIEDHSRAEFSHGICPDCFEKHRPDR